MSLCNIDVLFVIFVIEYTLSFICSSVLFTCLHLWLHVYTVQTFHSCTNQPDGWHCLVLQTPMANMSENKGSTILTHVVCKSKYVCELRLSMHPYPENCVAIGHAVVDGVPMRLVQKLNVSTVRRKCIRTCTM